MIGNQIEIVNENKDMKNDKNIKEINDKKLIIKRIWNNKKNDIKNKNENINIKNIINIKGINNEKLIRTIIGIFNWKDDRNIIGKNIKKY